MKITRLNGEPYTPELLEKLLKQKEGNPNIPLEATIRFEQTLTGTPYQFMEIPGQSPLSYVLNATPFEHKIANVDNFGHVPIFTRADEEVGYVPLRSVLEKISDLNKGRRMRAEVEYIQQPYSLDVDGRKHKPKFERDKIMKVETTFSSNTALDLADILVNEFIRTDAPFKIDADSEVRHEQYTREITRLTTHRIGLVYIVKTNLFDRKESFTKHIHVLHLN